MGDLLGYLALAVGSKYPELAAKLVIVDAYPFLAGITDPDSDAVRANAMATQIKVHGQSSLKRITSATRNRG